MERYGGGMSNTTLSDDVKYLAYVKERRDYMDKIFHDKQITIAEAIRQLDVILEGVRCLPKKL
jgi:hypothetical protein